MSAAQHRPDPFSLDRPEDDYRRWRAGKLEDYPADGGALRVEVGNPGALTDFERAEISRRIAKANMALYAWKGANAGPDDDGAKARLRALGRAFGLERLDANLAADEDAITPLSVDTSGLRARYIPYTDRPISWHTDGYYNPPERRIRAMVLHCVRPSAAGGENALMDPEIAYILLRDENPDFIRALMHPNAMRIPANQDESPGGGVIRPDQDGPVFSVMDDGSLHMRFTARTRSIVWRDDAATGAAVRFLLDLLEGPSPYVFRHRMAAGEGLICNNVLHNRTAFADQGAARRLVLRARYYDRIAA